MLRDSSFDIIHVVTLVVQYYTNQSSQINYPHAAVSCNHYLCSQKTTQKIHSSTMLRRAYSNIPYVENENINGPNIEP